MAEQYVKDVTEKVQTMVQAGKTHSSGSYDLAFYDFDIVEIGNKDKIYKVKNGQLISEKPQNADDYLDVGHIVFRIEKPGLYFCNSFKSIHGGAIATWIDCLTTVSHFAFDPKDRLMSVSLNMTIDYLTASMVN